MKAFWIRADNQTIEAVEQDGLADLQRMVGGYIEVAHRLPNGDRIFVDEEGLLKKPSTYFEVTGGHQPFAGNGVVTGGPDDEGEITDAVSTKQELERLIRFAIVFR